MAVRIANLKILVSASTAGLVRGLGKAGRSVKGFGAGIRTSLLGVRGFTAGIAGLVGVTLGARAAIGSLSRQFTELDKLGKTASKIGVTVTGLQKMRSAAKLAGVEVNTTDMALQRFTRRTAEAAVGTGEALRAFDDLGISAADFSKLSLEDQMITLADSMQRFSDSDQLRLAFKLFDSEGAALVNTLKAGGDALDDLFREREARGIFSEAQVRSIEDANDAMTRFGEQVNFVKGSIAAELSQSLAELVDRIADVGKTAEIEFGFVTDFIKGMALGVAFVIDGFDGLLIVIGKVGLELQKFSAQLTGAGLDILDSFGLAPENFGEMQDGLRLIIEEAENGISELNRNLFDKTAEDKVRDFFDDVRKRAIRTARDARAAGIGVPGAGGGISALLPQARLMGSAAAATFSAKRDAKVQNTLAVIANNGDEQNEKLDEIGETLKEIADRPFILEGAVL